MKCHIETMLASLLAPAVILASCARGATVAKGDGAAAPLSAAKAAVHGSGSHATQTEIHPSPAGAPQPRNPFAYNYSNVPVTQKDKAKQAVAEAIEGQVTPKWNLSTKGFVRHRYEDIWSKLREDYHLHGFLQLGIGTDELWETRVGLGVDLVPQKIRLGIEAATARFGSHGGRY